MIAFVKPSYLSFNKKTYPWKSTINYRNEPHRYRVGKGEQGVLICEPYKSEILPLWRFKTSVDASKSSRAIYKLFLSYLRADEFVGADMARKFLQMGFTRARRYANYKGGIKYNKENDYKQFKKGTGESEKAKSAIIFYLAWRKAESNKQYARQKKRWKECYG